MTNECGEPTNYPSTFPATLAACSNINKEIERHLLVVVMAADTEWDSTAVSSAVIIIVIVSSCISISTSRIVRV